MKALICALIAFALGGSCFAAPPIRPVSSIHGSEQTPAAVSTTGLGLTSAPDAPDATLLADYERRLYPVPPCLNDQSCAQVQKATLSSRGEAIVLTLEIHAQIRTSVALPSLGGAQWAVAPGADVKFARAVSGLGVLVEPGVSRVELFLVAQGGEVVVSFTQAPKLVQQSPAGWKVELPAQGAVTTVRLSRLKAVGSEKGVASSKSEAVAAQFDAPLFIDAQRVLRFDANGADMFTTFRRLSPSTRPASSTQDLLPGEKLLSEGIATSDGKKIKLDFAAGATELTVSTRWDYKGVLSLVADASGEKRETWIVEPWANAPLKFEGAAPISRGGNGSSVMFLPKPGEKLSMSAQFVVPIPGAQIAIDSSEMTQATGEDRLDHTWTFVARSTIAAPMEFSVPDSWKMVESFNNGQAAAVSRKNGKYVLDLLPGKNTAMMKFKQERSQSWWIGSPAVSIAAPVANLKWTVAVPSNQWVIFTMGPLMGPAVLIWGALAAMAVLSWVLARSFKADFAPNFLGWLAILLPISALSPWSALVVVVFVIALCAKKSHGFLITNRRWNMTQLSLMTLGVLSAVILLSGVYQGLLGAPDMMVAGNGSSAARLIWYQDKAAMDGGAFLGLSAGALLAPMWLWRALMLVWALWIASAVARSLPSMWTTLNAGGLWRKRPSAVGLVGEAAGTVPADGPPTV